MIKEIFKYDPEFDNGYSAKFKREANISLASLIHTNAVAYEKYKELYAELIPVIRAIGNIEFMNDDEINIIHTIINKYHISGILSHLTLKDDEFEKKNDTENIYINKRLNNIIKINDIIYNTRPFVVTVYKKYYTITNSECPIDEPYVNNYVRRVYITKGGVVTGKYIEEVIIPEKVVNNNNFMPHNTININVSKISFDKDNSIFVVDDRNTKLKSLRDFYIVNEKYDEHIAKLNIDIRKFKKLEK